ncbi:hypothetical protein RRG08_029736 [Elysia crispata]|uniref:Uncharacterized protein n=1 Tax=Elysia crispata TaxID=231223 RepID=A0AAE0ZHN2_9GAST|nr:hypothetical protein RRG08_029736 [Elysia crispata]
MVDEDKVFSADSSADSDGIDIESDKEAVREFVFRAPFTKEAALLLLKLLLLFLLVDCLEGIKSEKKRDFVYM